MLGQKLGLRSSKKKNQQKKQKKTIKRACHPFYDFYVYLYQKQNPNFKPQRGLGQEKLARREKIGNHPQTREPQTPPETPQKKTQKNPPQPPLPPKKNRHLPSPKKKPE